MSWILAIALFYVFSTSIVIKLIWTKSLFSTNQKLVNTCLCVMIPFIWSLITYSIVKNDLPTGTITKEKRNRKSGINGDRLTNYGSYGVDDIND